MTDTLLMDKESLESLSFTEVLAYFTDLKTEMPAFSPLADTLKSEIYQKDLSDPLLKGRTILLSYGGSTAYGLNKPNSDVDIRGIFMPDFPDYTTLTFKYPLRHKDNKELKAEHPCYIYSDFDRVGTYLNSDLDLRLHELSKAISLMGSANPDVFELLFCLPEHRIANAVGQKLVDNREIFLSRSGLKKSYKSYAKGLLSQFRYILSHDLAEQRVIYYNSLVNSLLETLSKIPEFRPEMLDFYLVVDGERIATPLSDISFTVWYSYAESGVVSYELKIGDKSVTCDNIKLGLDMHLTGIPIERYKEIFNRIERLIETTTYTGLTQRNKRPLNKMSKHAACLLQLYIIGTSLLRGCYDTAVYQAKHHNLLKAIREGLWCHITEAGGTERIYFDKAFFDCLDYFEGEFDKACAETKLPVEPDYRAIQQLHTEILTDWFGVTEPTGRTLIL